MARKSLIKRMSCHDVSNDDTVGQQLGRTRQIESQWELDNNRCGSN